MELSASPISRFLLLSAAFVVVIAGMRVSAALLVPFLLAIFIAVLCSPPMHFMRRHGIPTALAILIVVALIVLVGGVLGTIFGRSLSSFADDIPTYQTRMIALLNDSTATLQRLGLDVDSSQWRELVQVESIFPYVRTVLGSVGNLTTNAFMILLTVVFILAEEASFQQKLDVILPKDDRQIMSLFSITKSINQYMAIKAVISLVTGVMAGILCVSVGIEYAVLWGTLAFLLNFIPTLGSLLAAIPPVLLALMQLSPVAAAITATGYIVINVLIGNVIEPRVMGRGLGLSPLIVLMSLVFWGWVLGPVGMLLSVPLTMMVKIALESFPDTRWMGAVLGNLASVRRAADRGDLHTVGASGSGQMSDK